ncbi:latrophilin Cirl isoform X3 [Aethina tumida]|uniref:latrophilin Cirl isoform X3 n=1 Tax=Aethina tumida TaxID=116153 RepID=UPI002147EAE4|nr:latrophilin Cirl isoform X3 [Aethina tumida]
MFIKRPHGEHDKIIIDRWFKKGDGTMAWHGKVQPGLLLLLLSFVVISEATKSIGEYPIPTPRIKKYRYETAYACEGKTLKIECKEGELIKLIRANYGRFSITICNDHGNTDWSVNCMSPKSLQVLLRSCVQNDNSTCIIDVNNEVFGDPCPDTHKYIEVQYYCDATTTTTTVRPSPPWLITSQSPMWSTVKPSARPPPPPPKVSVTPPNRPASTTATTALTTRARHQANAPNTPPTPVQLPNNEEDRNTIPDEITTLPYTTTAPRRITYESTLPNTDISSVPSVIPLANDEDLPNHCAAKKVRGVQWNRTRVNETKTQTCPDGTQGFAKWHCVEINNSPQWSPQYPDLSECKSMWLASLDMRAARDPPISIASDLSKVTSSKTLYGGDMIITTRIIQKMTQKMSKDIQTFPDTRQREEIVTELLIDVAKTGSNLLDSSQHPSWRDLSYKEQMSVATSLLIGLEENAFLLADTVMSNKIVDKEFKNILLSVRVLDTKSLTTEVFPSNANTKWIASNDSIELPKGALLENSDGNFVRLVFIAFDRLEEILHWHPDTTDAANNKNVTRILNSKVISASLGKGRHIQLREPVKLTMKHLKVENVSNPTCVFWDYTTNAWSEEGCKVDASSSNNTHTVCLCDHLTNFAILMDVHAVYLPVQHEIALKVITYVGCVISIICLMLAVITFLVIKGIKSDRNTIHLNLCLCLFIAESIFLVGISQTQNRTLCGVFAGLLQYFFLCAFIWMFIEGFQLYVMLIEVFEAEKSRIKKYCCCAYGIPILIVGISALVYPQGYGTERHCWLQTDNYFIYSFVGIVMFILALNVIFLIMAIVMMCRHASASVSMKNKEHSRLASTSGKEENALQNKLQVHLAWLKGAFALVFLLGLTWTFGFLYLNEESVVMAYIFCVLNSLQGLFIFAFHCVQNEKIRKEYRKFIRKHSWLPKCLRCSKPGSGTNSSSGSSGMAKERRTSVYAGSNGNPSGTNSHSTDNSVLSPHGTSLQRGWNSQSCSNVNHVGKTPVTTSTSVNMAATLCRPICPGNFTPPPADLKSNTSTLPYIRNFCKNTALTPNMPKSVSTWGPLQKPHWKSYSRDSGHGGSEKEDSPRSHAIIADLRLNVNTNTSRRYMPGSEDAATQGGTLGPNSQQQIYNDYGMRMQNTIPHPKHLPLNQTLQPHGTRKKNGGTYKPGGYWSHHTYTEIFDGRQHRGLYEDDPVYEEIERNEIQVSDMSDEDGKRQSDMSRQSSRSYGDHRPLIPHSPGTDRGILDVKHNQAKEMHRYAGSAGAAELEPYRIRPNMYRGGGGSGTEAARSLAAVLDGETVVCHLEPPEMYLRDPYMSRTLGMPPYSES